MRVSTVAVLIALVASASAPARAQDDGDRRGFAGSLGDLVRDPRLNHRVEVETGVLADECGDVLRAFFRDRRA